MAKPFKAKSIRQAKTRLYKTLGITIRAIKTEDNETKALRFSYLGDNFRWSWNCNLLELSSGGVLHCSIPETDKVEKLLGIE